ncbi:MAG: VCBS repeat-containing protein [Archangiaceae bacterium]|nr:VCBS repeat-containing protein [Archangiaceae bacterium]
MPAARATRARWPLPVYALTAAALFDFDHDGRLDLVSAGATPDRGPFRIDLNASAHGLPSLQPLAMTLLQRDYQVNALAVGDLDADGRPDVALSTVGAADGISLRVFFSRPGGWQEMPGGLPGLGPYSALQLGDVDGDGSLDVVAVGPGQDRLLINDGSGHFFDASVLALPLDAASGTALLLVDLDRDSDLDLVTGNSAATMRLYVNDGHGKFNDRTPVLPRRIETVGWLGAANVDGDADTDVVLLAGGAAAVRIYLSVEP